MRKITLVAVCFLTLSNVPLVHAEDATRELRCSVAGGFGFGPVGKRQTTCVYYRRDGRVEFYIGSFGRLGLDIGPSQARQAVFKVVAPAPEPVGALQGNFVGAGVGVTLGRGLAGDALVGGQGVTIIPLANSRLTGLNVEAGIGDLTLQYEGTEGRRARLRDDEPVAPNF
jgi:hypothetical protein